MGFGQRMKDWFTGLFGGEYITKKGVDRQLLFIFFCFMLVSLYLVWGLWVEDRWNNQQKADDMIREAIIQLTGETTAQKAWKALFCHFNKEHGKGSRGYKKGEKITVKLNMNNAIK